MEAFRHDLGTCGPLSSQWMKPHLNRHVQQSNHVREQQSGFEELSLRYLRKSNQINRQRPPYCVLIDDIIEETGHTAK
ncbi:hypothetical protein OUZ56_002545 [Daphnia magna]|uniref:Uncharacterized protein n=1 Tax=Daphnia magna TaxID=35525 RepID=A0ABR0A624_9CRUS|nr:hypothetical protein OUZ56_002545 [Daphnia magna]